MHLNPSRIRAQFPALAKNAIYFDNPAGTQVPRQVLDRMNKYLVESNANKGGAFATAQWSDRVIEEAREASADFLNASRPEEIAFGPNMTTLTLGFARAFARAVGPGDTLVVTRLDHDANISPWMQVAEDRGAEFVWVDFDIEDGTLQMDSLAQALEKKPKLVAFGYASNALGTINPVRDITRMAHEAGALVFVDAVHYGPHGPIDVQDLDCDFLVCSAYKFFGPHLGMLYGKYDLMDELRAYKVRPASDLPPGKWETGTQNHEGIAGTFGAIEYLEWVGETFGGLRDGDCRRDRLVAGMQAIQAYEYRLSRAMLEVLESIPGVRVYGVTDRERLEERVPTFAINLVGLTPRALAEYLGEKGIYVWDGNYYALAVTQRLGVEDSGGMVRVGPVHYNTLEEVGRFGKALEKISSGLV